MLWWMADERHRIGSRALAALEAGGAELVVSAVTVWEVAIKRRLGKLDAPADLLPRLERAGVDPLPITARHGDRAGALPMHHRDPFDRLLVAQAEIEGFAVVSANNEVGRYDVDVVW